MVCLGEQSSSGGTAEWILRMNRALMNIQADKYIKSFFEVEKKL